jgi:hypothetical protein
VRALSHTPAARAVLAIVLLFAVLLGAQALAAANAPSGGIASTGRLLGQTSFAYLGGLRTFAAAILWNRLDPIFDGYYGQFDKHFAVFLPTMRLVTMLDPQFEQSYYVASYWLGRFGHYDEALDVAREGLRNNPRSGLLRANLVQILFIHDRAKNLPQLLRIAREGIGPDVTWANSDDQFEGYGIFAAVFHRAGDTATVAAIRRVQQVLKDNGAAPGVSMDATGLPAPGLK